MPQNLDTLKRMRHMVDQGLNILTGAGSLTPFGELLHEAWVAKQTLAETVTNDHINDMYQKARDLGAIGGKLLGAGGGGLPLTVCSTRAPQ